MYNISAKINKNVEIMNVREKPKGSNFRYFKQIHIKIAIIKNLITRDPSTIFIKPSLSFLALSL
jgi:hypothetical protein